MRTVLAGFFVMALSATAGANGRPPYTSTINFQRGNDQAIAAGMTFGLVMTTDGGVTWRWMCENSIGYSGFWDPDYAYTSSGALFATTFNGLKVMRDGCTFNAAPSGTTFVSVVEQSPDGSIFYAAADPNDVAVYKSTNDGMTFPTSASPGQINDWWRTIVIAPGNTNIVYLSGYRQPTGQPKQFLLFKSTNGGGSFTQMTNTGISPTSANSTIDFVGVAPDTTGGTPYVHVSFENGTTGDSIYKFNGTSWTKIYTTDSSFGLAFLARKDGTCIAAARDKGAFRSTTCTAGTFTQLANAPHIGCLAQDSAGVVYACTQNYAVPQLGLDSDGYGIMKSSDLSTWSGVLRYQDIKEPESCPAGTVQHDTCASPSMGNASQWCCLVSQLGITSTAVDCTGPNECGAVVVDGPPGGGDGTTVKPPKGCCEASASGPPALLTAFVACALLLRRRKPKR